jgi:hypothetical protein
MADHSQADGDPLGEAQPSAAGGPPMSNVLSIDEDQARFRLQEMDMRARLQEIANDAESRRQIEEADAQSRRTTDAKRMNMLARADFVRAIALIAVVAAIVATPIFAMVIGVIPEDYASYIAPVSGIAGAVIGYWFGASGKSSKSSDTSKSRAIQSPRRHAP